MARRYLDDGSGRWIELTTAASWDLVGGGKVGRTALGNWAYLSAGTLLPASAADVVRLARDGQIVGGIPAPVQTLIDTLGY